MIFDLLKMNRAELEAMARNLCMTARLSDENLFCRVLGEYIMYVDPVDRGITPHLALNGFWEAWVTLAMARQVQPGWRHGETVLNFLTSASRYKFSRILRHS